MTAIKHLWVLFLPLLLAACGSAAPVAGPAATAPASPEATAPVAATAPAVDTGGADDGGTTAIAYGRNDDGTYFYGAPDAPVTLIDYSDFL